MDVSARMSSKGQLTVPKSVREALGLEEGDAVVFRVVDGAAILAPIPDLLDLAGAIDVPDDLRGADWQILRRRVRDERGRRAAG